LLEQWAKFSELPAQNIVKQKELFARTLETEYKPANVPSSDVYNRIGKQIVAAGFVDLGGYLLKMHDLGGLVRLINLQIQIVSLNLPDERIGPFLQTSDAAFTDPYTGEAMLWDPKERTLSFKARGNEEGGEVAVRI
jgi:hypothetical protein